MNTLSVEEPSEGRYGTRGVEAHTDAAESQGLTLGLRLHVLGRPV